MHHNFVGPSLVLQSDTPIVGANFDDQASSIIVRRIAG